MTNRLDISDIDIPEGLPKVSLYTKPDCYEVSVSMFDKCNLRCKFCYQEHEQQIDRQFIQALDERILNDTREDLEKYKGSLKSISLLFMGGELFADDVPDEVLNDYKKIWLNLKADLNKRYPDIRTHISVSTNGIWKKRERILGLLRESTVDYVNLSYDPVGRFPNEEVLNTFYDTVRYVHDGGFETTVGFVATKPNINAVLNDNKYAEMLKSEYVTRGDLNMYICNHGWENDLPSDDDMFNFYKWCFDNELWKINFIDRLMKNYLKRDTGEFMPRYCDCKFETNISQIGTTKDCVLRFSSFGRENFYGKYADKLTIKNLPDVKALIGYKKLGCISCEHSFYCPMPCWCSVLMKQYEPKSCPLKKVFNYITDAHIESYKKWEETHG